MATSPPFEVFKYGGLSRGLSWLRDNLRPRTLAMILGTVLLILLAFNYYVFASVDPASLEPQVILNILIADFVVGLILAAIIGWRLIQIWIARRSGSAGSKLHARIVAMFGALAVTPAIVVAIFSAILFNMGIESWFSNRVTTAVTNSEEIARSYFQANVKSIEHEIKIMATELGALQQRRELTAMPDAVYLEGVKDVIRARGIEGNLAAIYMLSPNIPEPLASFEWQVKEVPLPTQEEFEEASKYDIFLLQSDDKTQIQALYKVGENQYFFFVRLIDPKVLEYQMATVEAVSQFRQAESNRFGIQMTFLLAYVVVALLLLLTAIWFGIWAANRLVLPIGRLVGAAEQVSDGNLGVRVEVADNDDEVSTLGRSFNRMTGQLQSQRNELMEANRQFDERRRFTEAVLAGVSAGVVGLDAHGRVNIANRSAYELLDASPDTLIGRLFVNEVPEMTPLIKQAMSPSLVGRNQIRGQIELERDGRKHTVNVRVSSEASPDDTMGFVVTFDEITDLVVAQRTAAWADVARRIAHEIKNPLTPIQLSAERLKRKYAKEITTDPKVFEQCTDTIIRQVGDIGRMVDEFSSFARMPEPVMQIANFSQIVKDAIFLQKVGNSDIRYKLDMPDAAIAAYCDDRLIAQALINVLKNAAEAVNGRKALPDTPDNFEGHIHVSVRDHEGVVIVEVVDNGCGLPQENRHRLTEPYMTTRQKGTGLGLAIVRKVLEDHNGDLFLDDAPAREDMPHAERGTIVRMVLPKEAPSASGDGEGAPETIDDNPHTVAEAGE
ncbi:MAG: PAS domain-containing sensor histidine kinase [Alphaproteobacteria bacterium]|nr:MAG: PAS domain-containing sensor histidine kinase [Alphaproteobacteria bacterium]